MIFFEKILCRRADDWPFVRNKEALGVPGSPQVGGIIDLHHPYRCQKIFLDHLWQVYVNFQFFSGQHSKRLVVFMTPRHLDISSNVTSFYLAESAPSLESFLFAGWQVLDQFDLRPINSTIKTSTTWGSTPIYQKWSSTSMNFNYSSPTWRRSLISKLVVKIKPKMFS